MQESEWINFPSISPEKKDSYLVSLLVPFDHGQLLTIYIAYWDGEKWLKINPFERNRTDEDITELVKSWAVVNPPHAGLLKR